MGGRHAAADDAGQVFGVVLFEVSTEVAHASLGLSVAAFLALDHGFSSGIRIGIYIVGQRVAYVGGRRVFVVASDALG
jgi:hypothetical protein